MEVFQHVYEHECKGFKNDRQSGFYRFCRKRQMQPKTFCGDSYANKLKKKQQHIRNCRQIEKKPVIQVFCSSMLNWLSDKDLSIKNCLNDEVRPKSRTRIFKAHFKSIGQLRLPYTHRLLHLFRYSYQLYGNIKQKIIRKLYFYNHIYR